MKNDKGIFEITNNEGMICYVDTATEGKKTYGQDWVDICESTLNGTILKGEIAKYQYRTHEGEPIDEVIYTMDKEEWKEIKKKFAIRNLQ